MCTVLLPRGDNPIAVNKYINISVTKHDRKSMKAQSGRGSTGIALHNFRLPSQIR